MKIKAVDVARKLNISKATVSLALNNKPGVSQQTKEAVLRCIEEMEQEGAVPSGQSQYSETKRYTPPISERYSTVRKQMIKIIIPNKWRAIIQNKDLDLMRESLLVYDREAARIGCVIGMSYIEMGTEDIPRIIEDSNSKEVAGVILYATDLKEEEIEEFKEIRKPMVIYDNEVESGWSCVNADNAGAAGRAVDLLAARGCKTIQYISADLDIYNFRKRREGFLEGMRKNHLEIKENSILQLENVYSDIKNYLHPGNLPDALIMEEYHVSLKIMQALTDMGLHVPKDISLVGIDELPEYWMRDEYRLTTLKIEHAQRARAAIQLLEQEIQGTLTAKFKLFSECFLNMGNSIR